ncbi:MAG: CRISPR-associated endonuclease Cas3'' [Rhizobiaceae bacterium]|nr:CRISPR-associated endonuclease Cas3'' [Rhizobiaceae bacterium]
MYFAHSGTPGDKRDWQPMADHAREVARLAAENADAFGMAKAGMLLGLAHDLGKYDPRFPPRLEGANIRVDHSTAGAKIVLDLARQALAQTRATPADGLAAELAAYVILGHHAGLPDKHSAEANCFERRIDGYAGSLDEVWRSEIDLDLSGLMPEAMMKTIAQSNHKAFDLSVLTRFLFSALVDADFKDTEAHYSRLKLHTPDRAWSSLQSLLQEFIARFDAHMAGKRTDSAVNQLRGEVLAHVRGKATLSPGLFTLTVPTGGGKTLASLGFALDHARTHGLRRIIYSIPFTSVIDQTADIFRNVLGRENVLEHHSAIDDDDEEQRPRKDSRAATSRDRLRLAMEDWAAPVIVTTNVQFFESLFAARTSRARKLHNIAGSIIILDEAQTLPRQLLKPCVRMIDALARLFGCTIVLCTATQPALGRERADGKNGFPDGLDLKGRELAPDPPHLFQVLKRTSIRRAGPMDNAALVEALRPEPQALVIVNSRRHALELYRHAQQEGLDGLVHLTTRQCAAHRRTILADIRARLALNNPRACRVIATSLVEAGVDLDFPKVWRAETGLDSIIQAAGRCNREGRRRVEDSVVTVFSAPDYKPPSEIAGLVGDMTRMARNHGDLQSLAAIEDYFGEVYWRTGDGLDGKEIYPSFKVISRQQTTDFAFRKVASAFRMIESKMEPVIIPFDDVAKKAVDELSVAQIPSGALARKLQTYVVQVPRVACAMLIKKGFVRVQDVILRGDQFAVLETSAIGRGNDAVYNAERGLLWETPEYLAQENSII